MDDLEKTIPQEDSKNNNTYLQFTENTYVKISRSLNKNDLFGDGACQAVLLNLIIEARRFPGKAGGRICDAGEVPFGIDALKMYTGFSKKVIWRCINKLEKLQIISTLRGHRGTHLTICNYLKYQVGDKHCGNTEGTSEGTTEGTTEGVHYKKERKKEGKKERRIGIVSLTPSQGSLLKKWVEFAQEASKTKIAPDEQKYSKAILDLERLCGVSTVRLEEVLAFVRVDDFWRPNALSLPGLLLKGKNGLRKIENILQAMEKSTNRSSNDFGRTPEQQRRYEEWLRSE